MGQFGRTFSHIDIFLITLQVILFEIDCAIFYTNFHELFCHFISWTKFGNSGKGPFIKEVSSNFCFLTPSTYPCLLFLLSSLISKSPFDGPTRQPLWGDVLYGWSLFKMFDYNLVKWCIFKSFSSTPARYFGMLWQKYDIFYVFWNLETLIVFTYKLHFKILYIE